MITSQIDLFNYIKKHHSHLLKSKKATVQILEIKNLINAGPDIYFYVKYGPDPLKWKSYRFSQCNYCCNCYSIEKVGKTLRLCEDCNELYWNHKFTHSSCFDVSDKNNEPFLL